MNRLRALLRPVDNERGMILVVSLVLLCMMTIIGVAAVDTTTTEIIIAGAEKDKRATFYAAEAGVDHGRLLLQNLFVSGNIAKMALNPPDPDWDFALNGSQAGINTATDTNYAGGAVWISNGSVTGGYTYTVRIWNNDDGGGATNDLDDIIYMRAVATRVNGGSSSIEITLQGGVTGGTGTAGYSAQAGAGSGKNFTSDDSEAIATFGQQL